MRPKRYDSMIGPIPITSQQKENLKAIAEEEEVEVTTIVRKAINAFVRDYLQKIDNAKPKEVNRE